MRLALLLASVGMLSAQYYPPAGGGSGGSVAASSVTAGTFGAGNYVFPGNVAVGTSLSVDGTTGIAATSKLANVALNTITAPLMLTAGVPSATTAANIVSLFSTCSGTQYLGADGACHTVSATGANAALSNLASVSINAVLGFQTGIAVGNTTNPAKNIVFNASGTYGTGSYTYAGTPTANRTITLADADMTMLYSGGPGGTPASLTLTNALGLPAAAMPALTGDCTTSAGAVSVTCGAAIGRTGNPLSQFAATTSAQFAGVLSDETGSGLAVFATSPTLTTPTIGAALATSITNLPPAAVSSIGVDPTLFPVSYIGTNTASRYYPLLSFSTSDNNATKTKSAILAYVGPSNVHNGIVLAPGAAASVGASSATTFIFDDGGMHMNNGTTANQIIGASSYVNGAPTSGNYARLEMYDASNGAIIFDETFSSSYYEFRRAGSSLLRLDSTGILMTPTVAKYNNVATAGMGVPPIYASASATAQTASIGTTNLQCGAAVCPAGTYRVHVYTVVTSTGTGTLTSTIGWTDPGQAQTITSPGIATTAKNFEQVEYTIRADGIANITYATTESVTGTYSIYVTLERLQ